MARGPVPVPTARSRHRALLAVTTVVVVVAAIATTLAVLRAAAPRACSAGAPSVAVAADPAVAGPLAAALGAEQHTADGTCVRVRVTARRAADVARDVAAGQGPQLWVAESSASVQLALPPRSGAAPAAETGPSLVRTPLVVVADPAVAARAGWDAARPSWRALLGGPQPVSIADPVRTGEGLLALLSATATLGPVDPANPPTDVVNSLVRLGRSELADPQDAFRDRAAAPAFVATEQAALAARSEPLAVTYPAEGSVSLDYPVMRLRRPAEPPELDPAVTAVRAALHSPGVLRALQAAGFRDPAGQLSAEVLGDDAPAGIDPAVPVAAPALPPVAVQQVLRLWTTVTTPLRLLSVADVSGSMDEPTPGGQTRIELTRDAGLTGLALFSEDSASGLWAFSRELTPTTDWLELSPLSDLGTRDGAGTHREAVQRAAATLPGLVRGGTALYDTVLAAVREVRDGYRPDVINTVALFTDGRNDDPTGIDRAALIDTLRAEASPARPVPVFAIGIGPDADLAELTAIAEATGGEAYIASDAAEIQRVFFDAYARSTCRGDC